MGGRGKLTTLAQREALLQLVDTAVHCGARLARACDIIGISLRTLARWRPIKLGKVIDDQRPYAQRPKPVHTLSEDEVKQVIAASQEPEYASLPPSQIVPKLADKGIYIASESSFYRILKSHDLLSHRGRQRRAHPTRPKTTYCATAVNQVWMWDITYLPSTVRGKFFYLYMIQDLSSRYGVAWEVCHEESGDHAADLIQKACWSQHLPVCKRPVLHQDNGSVMKSFTFRAKLVELGIAPSYSRPRVSDDNAYIESFFRTLKYAPRWPRRGFESLEQAQAWVERFMHWYNHEHQHSGIQFVTPAQRHAGQDIAILAYRKQVYEEAKMKNPQRWSGKTRDWSPILEVHLNPDKIKQQTIDQAA